MEICCGFRKHADHLPQRVLDRRLIPPIGQGCRELLGQAEDGVARREGDAFVLVIGGRRIFLDDRPAPA